MNAGPRLDSLGSNYKAYMWVSLKCHSSNTNHEKDCYTSGTKLKRLRTRRTIMTLATVLRSAKHALPSNPKIYLCRQRNPVSCPKTLLQGKTSQTNMFPCRTPIRSNSHTHSPQRLYHVPVRSTTPPLRPPPRLCLSEVQHFSCSDQPSSGAYSPSTHQRSASPHCKDTRGIRYHTALARWHRACQAARQAPQYRPWSSP
jgi:hypothetical protein